MVRETLLQSYNKRKDAIKKRLEEFDDVWKEPEKKIFEELCFCLCTPQSKARSCDVFIRKASESGALFKGTEKELRTLMPGVRFCDNKSRYITEARDLFTENGKIKIKHRISSYTPIEAREWLVSNVRGLGLKESSHFLRNIGKSRDLAILDRHILKNLKKHGVISEIPKYLTRNRYLDIEKKMKIFSRDMCIPLGEMDLLFWSEETGEIFK